MANPYVHAVSSAKRWGGEPEDYLKIHEKMDCSKAYFPDCRHRALTHTMFWVQEVMIPLFGSTVKVGDRVISVKDICEQHILEDYHKNFIPTPQDFLTHMKTELWMMNGIHGKPQSTSNSMVNQQ